VTELKPSYRVLHPRFMLGWVESVWASGNAHVVFDDDGRRRYVSQADLKLVVEETTYARAARDRGISQK
jgi:hypothetical protein